MSKTVKHFPYPYTIQPFVKVLNVLWYVLSSKSVLFLTFNFEQYTQLSAGLEFFKIRKKYTKENWLSLLEINILALEIEGFVSMVYIFH